MLEAGHLLNLLLFSAICGKKGLVLFDFQGNKRLYGKMFMPSVARYGKKYFCNVSTLRLHKQKNYRANFQTQRTLKACSNSFEHLLITSGPGGIFSSLSTKHGCISIIKLLQFTFVGSL